MHAPPQAPVLEGCRGNSPSGSVLFRGLSTSSGGAAGALVIFSYVSLSALYILFGGNTGYVSAAAHSRLGPPRENALTPRCCSLSLPIVIRYMSPPQQFSQSVLLGLPPTSPPRLVLTVLAASHHATAAGVPYAQCSRRFACGTSLCHFSCVVPPPRFRLAAVATTACGVLISWGGRLRFLNGEGFASLFPPGALLSCNRAVGRGGLALAGGAVPCHSPGTRWAADGG